MKPYAVITGASAGIGQEFAKQLAKEGYPLVLIARREERLKQLAASLPVECVVLTADLSETEECYRVFESLKEKEIEIFINNAGFGNCGRFVETEIEKDSEMIHVNIRAVHLLTKLMLRKMQEKDRGYILNVASVAGLMPAGPYMATYYATKAYVASLTQGVAEELKESKSRVYLGCLCPGPVDTEFNQVANVEFALKGITPQYCVSYALSQMKKRKTVIVPTLMMRIGMTLGRFLPMPVYVRLAAHQQKKKFK